ncbi:MAG: TonB-dependent receptor [Candidatus Kapabacteria bacterium]|nr:TonB-dependent receptor [Candidatus Kapabacteria bacterium]
MKKIIPILIILTLIISAQVFAGIYGILRGVVLDETGKPVLGAKVLVKGTNRGALTDKDGRFTISDINAGAYDIRVTFANSEAEMQEVRISADAEKEIKIQFEKVIQGRVMIVEGGREMVDKTKIGSGNSWVGQQLVNMNRSVLGTVSLSSGVIAAGSGFNIRGSRATETQVRVNGVDMGNQFIGGTGAFGNGNFPMVSNFAVEEIQVIKGGFSAEYGEALGGIVNSSLKTGRTDKYEALLRYKTDIPALFGSQANGVKIVSDGNNKKLVASGPGLKLQSSLPDIADIGVGGPLPMIEGSTFYFSTNYNHEQYRSTSFGYSNFGRTQSLVSSYDVTDPWGTSPSRVPNTQKNMKNFTPLLKFEIAKGASLMLNATYGITDISLGNYFWSYATDTGYKDNQIIPYKENFVKAIMANETIYNFLARFNHAVSNSLFYEVTLSVNANNEFMGRRADYNGPSFFSGYNLLTPQDNYIVSTTQIDPNRSLDIIKSGKDNIVDQWSILNQTVLIPDGFLPGYKPLYLNVPAINPLTGYIEGNATNMGMNNPYGVNYAYYMHGNSSIIDYRKGTYWQLDGSVTNIEQFGNFHHTFKAGFEGRISRMDRHYNDMPYDGQAFSDIYTDMWGGNIYAQSDIAIQRTSAPVKPWRFSVYVQDQIKTQDSKKTDLGIIISPGLRFDCFNANTIYRVKSSSEEFISIASPTGFANSTTKFQISPRVNVAYPVTDRSNIIISYGMFFKIPELVNLYDNFGQDRLRPGTPVGNPNLEAQRTNSYSIDYDLQLTEDMAITASAYYKDDYNKLGAVNVMITPTPYFEYSVREYGASKGLELSIRKRMTNNINFDMNYTLSNAISTASDAASNVGLNPDVYTGLIPFPRAPFPVNYDRLHRVNANINFGFAKNDGPEIWGMKPLQSTNLNFTYSWNSGAPYTLTNDALKAISERNALRGPSSWNTDMKIYKSFYLSDYLGDMVSNKMSVQIFMDVSNVLNNTTYAGIYTNTGDPLNDNYTLNKLIGNFPSNVMYDKMNIANPDSWDQANFDPYGKRYYSAAADFDKSGTVTQIEQYNAWLKLEEMILKGQTNFIRPRSVSLGIMINY